MQKYIKNSCEDFYVVLVVKNVVRLLYFCENKYIGMKMRC